MIRLIIPVLVAACIFGCRGQDAQVPMDPFYGQTKIAPPATGEITRRPAVDPYYPRSAAVSSSQGELPPPPAAASDPVKAEPAARLASNSVATSSPNATAPVGDRIQIPVSAHRELTSEEMLALANKNSQGQAEDVHSSDGPAPEAKRVVQTLSPREGSFARQSTEYSSPTRAPEGVSSRSRPVDINDLPPVDRGAGTLRGDRVQLASATDPNPGFAVSIPTRVDRAPSVGRYAWTDDYSRLRGQLEYLERDHCWKLRYIPVDRETDKFGGSVVIKDSESLSGFERGDFVEVRGRIAKQPEEGADFAPVYEVATISAL